MGNGELGDEGEELITNVLLPTPYSLLYNALIIGKKRVKLLTASIIEFDLLFNAHAYK